MDTGELRLARMHNGSYWTHGCIRPESVSSFITYSYDDQLLSSDKRLVASRAKEKYSYILDIYEYTK
jgi:hypothetical protein